MSTPIHTNGSLPEKKGDYWYIDRKGGRGVRKYANIVWLALVLGFTVFGAACCSNQADMLDASFQQDYAAANADGANRQTSDLLSGLVNTVTDTVNKATGLVGSVVSDGSKTAYVISANGLQISQAQIFFNTGEKANMGLSNSNTIAKVSFDSRKVVSFAQVILRDGSKWFFDNAGNPLPGVYAPRVNARLQEGKWYVDSSDAIDKVTAFFACGAKQDRAYQASGIVFDDKGPISYIGVQVKYDGSKWFFDSTGVPLPGGYTPRLTCTFNTAPNATLAGGTASAPLSACVSSSDLLDMITVYYADGSHKDFGTDTVLATVPLNALQTVKGIGARLKSDSSKWYFDNGSSKWFTDMD
jgi:hypothetical protein